MARTGVPWQRTAYWFEMAAGHLHITPEEYLAQLDAGLRWCGAHRQWEPQEAFPPNPRRVTGVDYECRAGRGERERARYAARRAVSH